MKRIAEALVECGYAKAAYAYIYGFQLWLPEYPDDPALYEHVDPFYQGNPIKECHARRQADALEDWLAVTQAKDHRDLWERSKWEVNRPYTFPTHQWRLDRIRFCFERLEQNDSTD